MRMSRLFSQTLREAPANSDVSNHQLLLRAGYIRQLGAGIFSYLPLARRSLAKIEHIMREEIDAIGGQEITMPVVQPADIWKETGRWHQIGTEMGRFQDKAGHDMVLAMTYEEAVGDLVRKEIRSYRQLPALVYQVQTKWRDETRPRAGLIRVREFTMLDSYSLDADYQGLDAQYRAHYQAYFNIFRRCGLPTIAVAADVGMMGGRLSHEYMYLTPVGEDSLLICDHCGNTANRQVAVFRKPAAVGEQPLPIHKVATPGITTIDALCAFLGISKSKTAKAVFMVASVINGAEIVDKFVFAVVRGDMEVNETKLANAVKASDLRQATESEIHAVGAVPGYGSPIAVHDALIIVDDAVAHSPNLVAGANEVGFHLLNVNLGRDYQAGLVCDIAAAGEGDACLNCGNPLRVTRGVEVGHIFQLGTRYSTAMGCYYQDADGKPQPVIMGSYGIGVGRLLACIAEANHDEMGLCWPVTVAPYHVELVLIGGDSHTQTIANQVYDQLRTAGVEVLYDDRTERPGVKFMDADLIGVPLRLTIGDRSLKHGGIELKQRTTRDSSIMAVADIVPRIRAEIDILMQAITSTLSQVTYNG
jgi:prolyl-tRNA synthetase